MTSMWRLTGVVLALAVPSPTLAQPTLADITPAELAMGKRRFEAQCSRCHGMQARGGEGADLARPTLRHAPTDAALVSVIADGIPGTGMPGSWMTDDEVRQVAAYVRSLGRVPETPLVGDPARGQAIYDTKGGCAACHIVDGRGGTLGPELTDIGARRGADYLQEAVLHPAATLPRGGPPFDFSGFTGYLVVRAVTADGREIRGLRVNEDAFSIQLRDGSNRFHSLEKASLSVLTKEFGTSLMPSARVSLTDGEIDDLVAYLAGLRGDR